MFEKEAKEYAKLNARQYIHNDGIGFCTSEEEVKQAFLAGLKVGEDMKVPIKWHDLRKDPNDLPVRRCIDNDGNVVRLFHNSWDKKLTWYRYDFHECEWRQMETEPIAWCEIPEYTEE